jgi:N-acetylated-alpha-linked acidic dipeptidase
MTDQLRETTAMENGLIRTNSYSIANDPTKKNKVPAVKTEVPYLDFAPLQNALVALDKSSNALSEAWSKSLAANGYAKLNKALYQAEQHLLNAGGLPRRSWYKHTLYAPGFYTGYGVKTMPGVREAIEERNWKEAQEQIGEVATAIKKFSDYLDTIAK